MTTRLIIHLADMDMIHINTLRAMLVECKKSADPVTIRLFTSKGESLEYKNCVVTSTTHRPDVVNVKILRSGVIRTIRTKLIYNINDMEVYL